MKSKYRLCAITLLAISFSLALTASAQIVSKAHARGLKTCHENINLCLQEINGKISGLRAYVRHVKPGDPVEFNPQPDPPGDPDPWYRQGLEAYKGLQRDLSDLAESSPWGRSKWTWSQDRIGSWKNTVSEAQEKLNRLGHSSDRNSANMTLNDLSASVQRLSRMINSRSR